MSTVAVPKALRARMTAQAHHRCGYCLTTELLIGAPMEIEHIIPTALGGQTEESNLWFACSLCKSSKTGELGEGSNWHLIPMESVDFCLSPASQPSLSGVLDSATNLGDRRRVAYP